MMQTLRSEEVPVAASAQVVGVRHAVRRWAVEVGFTLVEQTKIVTAASELARNMVDYGGGGVLRIDEVTDGVRRGVRLTFEDHGPGIADIEQALRDGFTSGGGMGLGLGGSKRLANEFEIRSAPGEGTTVIITRYKGAS